MSNHATEKRPNRWFRIAFQIEGSVLPSVLKRSMIFGLWGLPITLLWWQKWPVAIPALASIIPNIVLGLLLVFRTNTAYDRFWEGRKAWGTMNNSIRNLSRQIWVGIEAPDPQDLAHKTATMKLLLAFCVATKLLLRQDDLSPALDSLVSPAQMQRLAQVQNPPLEIATWVEAYLQRSPVHPDQLRNMQILLGSMVDALGTCERILRTPMPLAYAIHLKQLLVLYCFSLPFQVVGTLGWWTPPLVVLIAFTLLGIEAIGIEIENPFGSDPNDLPLDRICDTMAINLQDLMNSA
jgi:ion channel-forming bestrophin family protein